MAIGLQASELLKQYGRIYANDQSQALLQQLIQEIEWQGSFVAYGRRFEIPRRQAWFADQGIQYRYAENQLQRQDWNDILWTIKQDVETACGETFNSVLVTHYRDGQDYVGWHADDENELGRRPVIASLSLGVGREFHYRHKQTADKGALTMNDGELLVMQAGFQEEWQHCVPLQSEVNGARINLTFRRVQPLYDWDKARDIVARAYKD